MAINTPTNPARNSPSSPSTQPYSIAFTATQIPDLSYTEDEISIASVARYFGGNGYRPDKVTSDRIHRCIEATCKMVTPQATYTLFPISGVNPGKEVLLEKGARLGVPQCFIDTGARFVAAIIGTLGEELEQHCRALAGKGEIYRSTLFDAVGTVMLDLLSEKVCTTIEKIGHKSGLVKGSRFAPGIDGYPLEQQHLLFQMADNISLGVFLNSSAIMVPSKSISFFMVLSTTALKNETHNKCSLCRLLTCQYRKAPEEEIS